MTLDDYIIARFGPVLSELSDMGYPTEELGECLKWGVTMNLLASAKGRQRQWTSFNFAFWPHVPHYSKAHVFRSSPSESDWLPNDPDAIFPHLSHLIEQEALT